MTSLDATSPLNNVSASPLFPRAVCMAGPPTNDDDPEIAKIEATLKRGGIFYSEDGSFVITPISKIETIVEDKFVLYRIKRHYEGDKLFAQITPLLKSPSGEILYVEKATHYNSLIANKEAKPFSIITFLDACYTSCRVPLRGLIKHELSHLKKGLMLAYSFEADLRACAGSYRDETQSIINSFFLSVNEIPPLADADLPLLTKTQPDYIKKILTQTNWDFANINYQLSSLPKETRNNCKTVIDRYLSIFTPDINRANALIVFQFTSAFKLDPAATFCTLQALAQKNDLFGAEWLKLTIGRHPKVIIDKNQRCTVSGLSSNSTLNIRSLE